MSVKPKEMDAVLSYLKMEIGWYYYKIEYTEDDEKRIEEGRHVAKKATKNKSHEAKKAFAKWIAALYIVDWKY